MAKKIEVMNELDSGEDPKLIAIVDEMMDPSSPKEKKIEPVPDQSDDSPKSGKTIKIETEAEDLPVLDIFADTPSAPLIEKEPKEEAKAEAPASEETKLEVESTPEVAVDMTSNKVEPSQKAIASNPTVNEYDDSQLSKAIEDIVSHESDEVLLAEDSKLDMLNETAKSPKDNDSHKLFWTLVVLVCLVAIAMAVFLVDPNFIHSLKKINPRLN